MLYCNLQYRIVLIKTRVYYSQSASIGWEMAAFYFISCIVFVYCFHILEISSRLGNLGSWAVAEML